jgi:hypothetical protein
MLAGLIKNIVFNVSWKDATRIAREMYWNYFSTNDGISHLNEETRAKIRDELCEKFREKYGHQT